MRISDWSSDVCSSDLAGLKALDFPAIERAKLKNGIEVVFARRATVPTVQVAVSFDAGYAADPHNALGTQSLMLSLMDERSEERRVGNECVSTCSYWWSPYV